MSPATRRRVARGAAALLLGGSAAACGGGSGLLGPATSTNVDRQFSVYAMTGSPAILPTAYRFSSETLVRPQLLSNGSLNFEMAFDITADGRVLLLPAAAVSPAPPLGAPVLRIQRARGTYESVTRAPTGGYATDTTLTAQVGDAFVLQLPGAGCFYGDPFYAKLGIVAIVPEERRVVVTAMVNRNCGYRALTPGLPKD